MRDEEMTYVCVYPTMYDVLSSSTRVGEPSHSPPLYSWRTYIANGVTLDQRYILFGNGSIYNPNTHGHCPSDHGQGRRGIVKLGTHVSGIVKMQLNAHAEPEWSSAFVWRLQVLYFLSLIHSLQFLSCFQIITNVDFQNLFLHSCCGWWKIYIPTCKLQMSWKYSTTHLEKKKPAVLERWSGGRGCIFNCDCHTRHGKPRPLSPRGWQKTMQFFFFRNPCPLAVTCQRAACKSAFLISEWIAASGKKVGHTVNFNHYHESGIQCPGSKTSLKYRELFG